jgi:glycosyltransferase involved in cell wall biosynthesis
VRLLALSPVYPDSPCDGDRLRLFHWLRVLGRRHRVTLLCLTDPARPADAGPSALGGALEAIHRVPWPQGRRVLSATVGLAGPRPAMLAAADAPALRRAMDAVVAGAAAGGRPFDAVFAYRLKMAPLALRFRGPRFLDYCDSMTRYAERRATALALDGHGLRAAFQRGQARRLAAWETRCAREFDAGFFNARQDAATLAAMEPSAAGRLQVAANGVEAGAFRRPARAPQPGKTLVFVGHLAYPPNSDAVLWFARKVLPLLRAADPELVFEVVGGGAPKSLQALQGAPGLRFTGFVADTRPRLWAAAVSVCPVRTGAGRQNKLLEAFAAGTPCVATPLAAAGAEAVDGRHLLVAEEPSAWADAVLRLCRRPALGRRLASQAQGLLGKLYRWEDNARVMERTMTRAARRPLW